MPISAQRPFAPQSCRIDGHEVAYVRSGAGDHAVLLIHGITASSFVWDQVIPHLEDRCDVVAVDLLGCGDSDRKLPADYSLNAHATRLSSLLDHLGWDRLHMVGHDIGGGVSQIFAVSSPERLHSMALVNTVGYDYWPVQPIVAMRTPFLRQLAMATLDTGMLRLILRRALVRKERLTPAMMARFHGEIAAPDVRKAFFHFARSLNSGEIMAIVDRLGRLQVPTLLVRGDGDVYLSAQICQRLHRELPVSRLVRIPTAGHFIQLDEPKLLAEHLIQHIESFAGE